MRLPPLTITLIEKPHSPTWPTDSRPPNKMDKYYWALFCDPTRDFTNPLARQAPRAIDRYHQGEFFRW